MRERRVQTNEPGRCATLLPLLLSVPEAFALLELGASAGLCLLADRYSYEYTIAEEIVSLGEDPELRFPCTVLGSGGTPDRLPEIAWRMGVDLSPIDPADPSERAWLLDLVWPEHRGRSDRLARALDVAASARPLVVQGDVSEDLTDYLDLVPRELPLVVMHSALLSYLPSRDVVERVVSVLKGGPFAWISNEGSRVVPSIIEGLQPRPRAGSFVLARDGVPVALTGAHGQSLEWL